MSPELGEVVGVAAVVHQWAVNWTRISLSSVTAEITPLNWTEWFAVICFSIPVIFLDEFLDYISCSLGEVALHTPLVPHLYTYYREARMHVLVCTLSFSLSLSLSLSIGAAPAISSTLCRTYFHTCSYTYISYKYYVIPKLPMLIVLF